MLNVSMTCSNFTVHKSNDAAQPIGAVHLERGIRSAFMPDLSRLLQIRLLHPNPAIKSKVIRSLAAYNAILFYEMQHVRFVVPQYFKALISSLP